MGSDPDGGESEGDESTGGDHEVLVLDWRVKGTQRVKLHA